ncbi:hypothetical protein LCGC14_2649540 [marine sediment metagenome]|uniref:Uncharacterized protein n=1 Tax=marine sediment metagenome TaxID=412755 RepID=A0A0F8ZV29_9ZZZZ
MKAKLEPKDQPNVIITVSWKEATILRSMSEDIGGLGSGRVFTDSLGVVLNNLGVPYDESIGFSGSF